MNFISEMIFADNQARPEFPQSEYRVNLPATTLQGSLVISVVATDTDSSRCSTGSCLCGTVVYSIYSSNAENLFYLADDTKGELHTLANVDSYAGKDFFVVVKASNPTVPGQQDDVAKESFTYVFIHIDHEALHVDHQASFEQHMSNNEEDSSFSAFHSTHHRARRVSFYILMVKYCNECKFLIIDILSNCRYIS